MSDFLRLRVHDDHFSRRTIPKLFGMNGGNEGVEPRPLRDSKRLLVTNRKHTTQVAPYDTVTAVRNNCWTISGHEVRATYSPSPRWQPRITFDWRDLR